MQLVVLILTHPVAIYFRVDSRPHQAMFILLLIECVLRKRIARPPTFLPIQLTTFSFVTTSSSSVGWSTAVPRIRRGTVCILTCLVTRFRTATACIRTLRPVTFPIRCDMKKGKVIIMVKFPTIVYCRNWHRTRAPFLIASKYFNY